MMKYLILTFFVAFGMSGRAVAQQWEEVNNAVTSNPMVFATNDSGYTFDGVHLMRTTDSGKNFSSTVVSATAPTTIISDMSWPTSRCGYMAYKNGLASTIARTNDGGQSVTFHDAPSNLIFYDISFPTPAIGYATGEFNPTGSGYFVAKSTDSGSTWNVVYTSTSFSVGQVRFKTATDGIFVLYSSGGVPEIAYTFDGLKNGSPTQNGDATLTGALQFGSSAEISTFLNWNDDGSWIVQYEGVQRSSDLGKTWNSVLPDEDPVTSYGAIETVCFSGPRGFAFADNSNVFETSDYGATWQNATSTSPYVTGVGSFSSMPSPTVAYVTGTSADGNTNVLLKIDLPPLPGGGVSMPPPSANFHVAADGAGVFFTADAAMEPRSIEILDVLGRECASLPLAAMSAQAALHPGQLRPGSYFARLDNTIVKFCVWQ